MDIDVKVLKELRERTGAGILDCKKALTENNSDIEKAAQWLREKGIAKAVKKASRVSAEGLFDVLISGNKAYVYELNCETDFVAANQKFKDLIEKVGSVIVSSDSRTTEAALLAKDERGVTVETMLLEFTAVIGEKSTLRNVEVIEKTDEQVFGVYKHNGGKIAVITVVEGGDELFAKQLAMHVCANDPQYLDETKVDQEYLENEKALLTKEAKEQNPNKPDAILEKMIEGRIKKSLKDVCLIDQAYLLDSSFTVGEYLNKIKAKIKFFTRKVVGAGIEKKASNFAEEVMDQIK